MLLITTIALFLYSAVLTAIMWPGILCVLAIGLFYRRKRPSLWAHGDARWANTSDLRNYIGEQD